MEGVYNRLPIPYFYNWPCEALLTGAFCDYSQQTLATSLLTSSGRKAFAAVTGNR